MTPKTNTFENVFFGGLIKFTLRQRVQSRYLATSLRSNTIPLHVVTELLYISFKFPVRVYFGVGLVCGGDSYSQSYFHRVIS